MSGASVDAGPLVPSTSIPLQLSTKSCATGVDHDAPLRFQGPHIAIYVDDDVTMHQPRIDSIGAAFEAIMATNTAVYGPTTDLDGNGVVYAIMTSAIPGGAYCDSVRRLRVEAFYTTWSPTVRIESLMALFAHEHQHVIHSGIRIQRQDDALWLNEALSLAAEALNEYWYTALPRAWLFLNGQNTGLTMLETAYSRSFDEKYMMFLLYLRDRFGDDFFARLETNPRSDVANIESTTGLPIEIVLRDWFVASGVSGRGSVDDPAYTYESIDLHGMAAEAAACVCLPDPFFAF